MKYMIGDVVIVREDLSDDSEYAMDGEDPTPINKSMERLRGCEVRIRDVDEYNSDHYYRVTEEDGTENDWFWTDEMFEGYADNSMSEMFYVETDLGILFERE